MNEKSLVVGIGEVLWDVYPSAKQMGGAPANFACHVTKSGCNGLVASAVGIDDLGKEICAMLDRRGVATLIERIKYPTGRVLVTLDDKGIPFYDIVKDVAWDYIPFTDKLQTVARNTVAVCYGSLAQRSERSRQTIMAFVDAVPDLPDRYKIFDVNLRQDFYDKEVLYASMQRCNILKINDEELLKIKELFEYPASSTDEEICYKLLRDYSLRLLILTCGARGSYVYSQDKIYFRSSPKVKVVDTVGAGDSFTAAFVSSLIKGADIETAHKRATDTAAYVCTQKGAMPDMPVIE